ncbi:hypothetical protein NC651_022242 [Populus alba x Populus x berolinensis]|nr:hypothetical protein NC651_022242 [Populus alba x Populus x berolinensis]
MSIRIHHMSIQLTESSLIFWQHHMTAFPPTKSLIYPYFKHTGHHFNQKRKLSDYILCELCLGIQLRHSNTTI